LFERKDDVWFVVFEKIMTEGRRGKYTDFFKNLEIMFKSSSD